MKRYALLIFILFTSITTILADEQPPIDTMVMVEQVNITAIKQGLNLYREPVAATVISSKNIEKGGITAMKDVAHIVPNLHIPNYGSRTTSTIYVRGLGARIDQPVVGLNIDNVPFLNKNSFDFEVMDIERIEVLRGPQSTLYGRNTMGGVINIYTLSPMSYQGVRLGAEYSSGNSYSLKASSYQKHSEKFGSAIGLYYNSSDGLITNTFTNEKCDNEQSFGGRVKLHYAANQKLRFENTLSASRVDQGGYPYKQLELGEVRYNDPSGYKRTNVSNGLTIRYQTDSYQLAAITGYQYLDDLITLDNDFTEKSYFILNQAIQEHSLTEDIVFRSKRNEGYNSLFGLFGFMKNQDMQAPVTFKEYGIEQLILKNANKYFAPNKYVWDESQFDLGSDFANYTMGAALYHESSFTKPHWKATLGLRLDYEKATLDYRNFTSTSCSLYDGNDEFVFKKKIDIDNNDTTSQSFFEFLPKVNFLYRLGRYNQTSLYLSVAKGYKAGGFNTQMFSDILQQQLMKEFGVTMGKPYDINEVITYKPEHSWNYEVGSHLESRDSKFAADIALFYIDCRNQQLTIFPEGQTTGRMMTNAGRSRSCGAEVALRGSITERLSVTGSYGYTNAKFVKYIDSKNNYAGNYVPYAPQHNIFGEISYELPIKCSWLESIGFDINTNGAGKIYWNEDNSRYQSLYVLLNSSIRFEHKSYSLHLWAKNLTQERYDLFYFKSIGNEFVQSGLPLTMGVKLTINL